MGDLNSIQKTAVVIWLMARFGAIAAASDASMIQPQVMITVAIIPGCARRCDGAEATHTEAKELLPACSIVLFSLEQFTFSG